MSSAHTKINICEKFEMLQWHVWLHNPFAFLDAGILVMWRIISLKLRKKRFPSEATKTLNVLLAIFGAKLVWKNIIYIKHVSS